MLEIFVCLAAVVHIYIFVLESIKWGSPRVNRVFAVTPEEAASNRLFAFNQGFYNLFLAIAAGAGLYLGVNDKAGFALVVYALLSMLLAAIVLLASSRRMLRAAVVQGGPPLCGLIVLFFN